MFAADTTAARVVAEPAAGTTAPAPDGAAETSVEDEVGNKPGSFEDLIEAVRREKLALSTLLEKCESWRIADGELRLDFTAQDRFSAERVNKERDMLVKHASRVFSDQDVRRLRVEVLGGEQNSSSSVNEQAEIVKKIFRGEIVDKGE